MWNSISLEKSVSLSFQTFVILPQKSPFCFKNCCFTCFRGNKNWISVFTRIPKVPCTWLLVFLSLCPSSCVCWHISWSILNPDISGFFLCICQWVLGVFHNLRLPISPLFWPPIHLNLHSFTFRQAPTPNETFELETDWFCKSITVSALFKPQGSIFQNEFSTPDYHIINAKKKELVLAWFLRGWGL